MTDCEESWDSELCVGIRYFVKSERHVTSRW